MKKLTPDQLITLSDVAFDAEVNLRSYSGRAMFGEHCLGVSGDEANIARFLVVLATVDPNLAETIVDSYRTDSLGLAMIAYFTRISAEGIEDEDDEDDGGW